MSFLELFLIKGEKRMKIGLLEDNANIHEYLTTALEMVGHTVFTHIDGMSLLDILYAEQSIQTPLPYDLLIIDLSREARSAKRFCRARCAAHSHIQSICVALSHWWGFQRRPYF